MCIIQPDLISKCNELINSTIINFLMICTSRLALFQGFGVGVLVPGLHASYILARVVVLQVAAGVMHVQFFGCEH